MPDIIPYSKVLTIISKIEKDFNLIFKGFSEEVYKNSNTGLKFECEKHGVFEYPLVQINTKLKRNVKTLCLQCLGTGVVSESSRVARAIEACNDLNLTFIKTGNEEGYKTRIFYCCNLCGKEHNARLGNLENGKGCPACKLETISNKRTNKDLVIKEMTEILESKQLCFKSFHKEDNTNNRGKTFIEYYCPICSQEAIITPTEVRRFKGCPKCNNHYTKTKEELLELLSKECLERGYGYNLETLIPNFNNTKSKIKIICPHGHEYIPSIDNFLNKKSDCPCMKKTGFDPTKPAYFYLLRITGSENSSWLKFGITNNIKIRISAFRRSYKASVDILYLVHFDLGVHSANLESVIKQIRCEEEEGCPAYGDGYTETLSLSKYDTVIGTINSFIESCKDTCSFTVEMYN